MSCPVSTVAVQHYSTSFTEPAQTPQRGSETDALGAVPGSEQSDTKLTRASFYHGVTVHSPVLVRSPAKPCTQPSPKVVLL